MEEIKKEKKKKILWIGDFATTGFGIVTMHICDYLYSTGKYDLVVLGTNYYGWRHNRPYWVYDINPGDWYGEQKLKTILFGEEPDIIIQINDAWCTNWMQGLLNAYEQQAIKDGLSNRKPMHILYFPVDSDTILPELIDAVNKCDKAITYLNYGKNQLKNKVNKIIDVIPHGVDTKDYDMLDEEKIAASKKNFGWQDDWYIIGQVNRNQPRKALGHSMWIFKLFQEGYNCCKCCNRYYFIDYTQCPYCYSSEKAYTKLGIDTAKLYFHAVDIDQDGSIIRKAQRLNIGKDRIILPGDYNIGQGFPMDVMNAIVNCFNVGFTTTIGEGWGLFVSDFTMLGNKPLILPKIEAFEEIYPKDLVYWMKPSQYLFMRDDNDVLRKLCSVEDGVDNLFYVYNHPEEAKEKAQKLKKYMLDTYSWTSVYKEWEKYIDDLEKVKLLFDLKPV